MTLPGIHTDLLREKHAYTRSSVPWRLDDCRDARADVPAPGRKVGFRLFRYLSGGGMRSLGRTVEQEEVDRRQNRFLAVAGALGVAWLLALVW